DVLLRATRLTDGHRERPTVTKPWDQSPFTERRYRTLGRATLCGTQGCCHEASGARVGDGVGADRRVGLGRGSVAAAAGHQWLFPTRTGRSVRQVLPMTMARIVPSSTP